MTRYTQALFDQLKFRTITSFYYIKMADSARSPRRKPQLRRPETEQPPCRDYSPPPYTVRISRKARRISLRMLPGKGLEVVLPRYASPDCVPELLLRHRTWVEKTFARMRGAADGGEPGIPTLLRLKGGREEVRIRLDGEAGKDLREESEKRSLSGGQNSCRPGEAAALQRFEPERFVLHLPQAEEGECLRLLRVWLREKARAYLGEELGALARAHGFAYSSLSIRFQKSRWGSCSRKGAISLNACLLFLPEPLTRYILAHELCHTRRMDHSPAFWKLLFAVEPEALARDRAMRGAWRFVPGWIFA